MGLRRGGRIDELLGLYEAANGGRNYHPDDFRRSAPRASGPADPCTGHEIAYKIGTVTRPVKTTGAATSPCSRSATRALIECCRTGIRPLLRRRRRNGRVAALPRQDEHLPPIEHEGGR